jgi:hypothetical protein
MVAFLLAGGPAVERPYQSNPVEFMQACRKHTLDETFPGGRPTASGKHHKWDKLFLRVKPADKK